ncbi:PadR family transcriptional regulator [Austwickia chelonae]|uniref:PadR family transcriptional regulator n=1 Tax=Austwickia chelonae TaxID=100225 RepID=UPI001F0880A9|nr:PadR family transcriptional regulator [Austwickia chelonae]
MLKGILSLLLLRLIQHENGYGIVTRLRDAGFDDLVEDTVYPALTRLEAAGHLESYLIKSSSGPARKCYRITEAGRAELARAEAAWSDLVATVTAVAGRLWRPLRHVSS